MATAVPGFEDFAPSRPIRAAGFAGAALTGAALLWLARRDIHPNPLFHAHGYCYLWEPSLVGAHVVSDLAIGTSYLAISATLAYLVFKARRSIPFGWMFLAFGAFIVACGATHFMEVLTLWHPWFWTAADLKIVTALASVGTAVALPPLVPRVVTLIESARLSASRGAELQRAKDELELRVLARTTELEEAVAREQGLRKQAEDASRVKDEFLGLISHELRTPLNAILGWSSMLAGSEQSAVARDRGLAAINRNARIQAKLVDDLLDTSRVIAGKLRIDLDPIPLSSMVVEAIESIRPSAEAKRIRVAYENQVPRACISGDAQRLQQIIWNLLTNAVKFTPAAGRIDVSATSDGTNVRIVVQDSGIGIDPAFLPHVFERFSQADTSPARAHNGLGLGLALVRHLTELHGGQISVESDGPGRGARFSVSFPLLGMLPPATRTEGVRNSAPDLSRLRVLVVDDDLETLEMLSVGLTNFGATVLTASSAQRARDVVSTEALDVLVSDLAMPGEDGLAMIRILRDQGITLPAVALTAHVRPEDRRRVLAAGFREYVAKPATPFDVATAITLARGSF